MVLECIGALPHGKMWPRFPNYWSPHNLFTMQTSSQPEPFSTYVLGCSPRPVLSVCSIASSVASWVALPGAPSWHQGRAQHQEGIESIERSWKVDFLLMNLSCCFFMFFQCVFVHRLWNVYFDSACLIAKFKYNRVTQCIANLMFQHQRLHEMISTSGGIRSPSKQRKMKIRAAPRA